MNVTASITKYQDKEGLFIYTFSKKGKVNIVRKEIKNKTIVYYKVFIICMHFAHAFILSKIFFFFHFMHYAFPGNRTHAIGIARAAGIPKEKMTKKETKKKHIPNG